MLRARAPIATSFPSDYHFYHHVDTPQVQALRERFVRELRESRPRFLVEVVDRPRPSGPHTSTSYPALEAFVAGYDVVATAESARWRILERRQ